jgi:hypothetical protein
MTRIRSHKAWDYTYTIAKHAYPMLPVSSVKYLGRNATAYTYSIRMPVTLEEERFTILTKYIKAKCVPQEILAKIGHFQTMTRALQNARDLRPMHRDLTPLDSQEIHSFGLSVPRRCADWTRLQRILNKDTY